MTESTTTTIAETPGPWYAALDRSGEDRSEWCVRDRISGAYITGWGRVMQSEANARLMAAAPEMLAFLHAIPKGSIYEPEIEALIAKAEGHQPPPPTSHYFNKPIDQMPCH